MENITDIAERIHETCSYGGSISDVVGELSTFKKECVKEIPLETVVGEKTEDVDPVIVNITEERFIHTMNILESVANKTISVPVDSILIENNKEKLLVETICEMQKSVVFAMETLSSFSA